MNLTINLPSVNHHTFTFERHYRATSDRVFAKFSDAVQKQRWFVHGDQQVVEEFTLDFRVGGLERSRQRVTAPGPFHNVVFTGESIYLDIVPNNRIVAGSTMDVNDRRISAALLTFEFLAIEGGTKLVFTHQAAFFEGADGPEIREMGWRKLFDRLDQEMAD